MTPKLISFFILSLFSCSYFHREPGSPPKINGVPIPDQQRYVYVQNFRNSSYGPGAHTLLSQLVKDEIDKRGRFIQTRDKTKGAYRIYGEVIHYQIVGNLLDNAGQHVSKELTVIVKIEIQKAGGDKLLLERDEIEARVYFSDQIGYQESEDQALSRLLRILAIRISEESERAWYYSITGKIDN